MAESKITVKFNLSKMEKWQMFALLISDVLIKAKIPGGKWIANKAMSGLIEVE